MIEIGEQGHLKCWADKRPLRKASSYWDHSGPCLCPLVSQLGNQKPKFPRWETSPGHEVAQSFVVLEPPGCRGLGCSQRESIHIIAAAGVCLIRQQYRSMQWVRVIKTSPRLILKAPADLGAPNNSPDASCPRKS